MKRLPSSQLEIMLAVWELNQPVTRNQIKNILTNNEWAVTTLNSFLTRLVNSGFLSCKKEGKEYVYTAIVKKEDYLTYESKAVVKKLFHNSVKGFLTALCSDNNMSKKEIHEIEEFLQNLKRNDSNAE